MSEKDWVVSERGLITYGTIIDRYGSHIKVEESSNGNEPHVWILIDGYGSAHLNLKQASAIRDALTDWIDQIPSRWNLNGGEED